MIIFLVCAELLNSDGQTGEADVTKLIVALRNLAKATKNCEKSSQRIIRIARHVGSYWGIQEAGSGLLNTQPLFTSFYLNAAWQFTSLLSWHVLAFSLRPVGGAFYYPTPLFLTGYNFWFRPFWFTPAFHECNHKQGICVYRIACPHDGEREWARH